MKRDGSVVVVLGSTHTHVNEGSMTAVHPLLPGQPTDLAWMLKWAPTALHQHVTAIYPFDPTGSGREALAKTLIAEGWAVRGTTGADTAWWSARRGPTTVTIGVREWAGDDPMIGRTVEPPLAARLLWHWHHLTGTPYLHTPGVAAAVNMRRHPRNDQPLWLLRDMATTEYWQPPGHIVDIRYRTPNHIPRAGLLCHRWDMRSAYLASLCAAILPLATPRPTGVEPNGVGYYRVRTALDRSPVETALGTVDQQGCLWLTHATRGDAEIVDSYTTDGRRLLRNWGEHWRDAIAAANIGTGSHRLAAALKSGYAQAIGLLNVPRGTIYRPDWRHIIIDGVRASMLRRIGRVHQLTGLTPIKVDVDSIWYAADAVKTQAGTMSNMDSALGVAPNIGAMRYEGEGLVKP